MTQSDHIIMDFWKFYPEKILLSEKITKMTAQQFGAYWLIVCQFKIQTLPGVAPADEEKLMAWGRLAKDIWRVERGVILTPFLYHPDTATLHHEFVKGLYLDQFNLKFKRKIDGSRGGQIKNHGKAKKPTSHPIVSPYLPFKPLYSLQNATPEDLDGVFTRQNKVVSTPPIASLYTPHSNESINRLMNDSAQQTPAPLEEAGSVSKGDGDDHSPIKLGTFLREAAAAAKASAK